MLLTLGKTDIRHAHLHDESGNTVYKINTPHLSSHTTIHRGHWHTVARIDWHWGQSATFHVDGHKMKSKHFIRKRGWIHNTYTFSGPDGVRYEWKQRGDTYELRTKDGHHTVALFHPPHWHLLRSNEKASLEIFPAGHHVADTIVMTLRTKVEAGVGIKVEIEIEVEV
ncbi:hypothetical protein CONPUDRAFT_70775 [Coniophora puteana RWD-64-598 SS2]|uniref:DUF6593 domain-containing protein n=1 Tax=Coniophora puteana (strain RWD-64-598) TaxID=741705 RepID=A0A5M3MYI3_CONPW|nr:uncharacterized protein CONPUDRAFT_70775 [Coniophora puteana RWD-64-598 SS2]EIW83844.1 hypothetical protein CONPUDRAFT_70775 [Coniophora puteana RWD-64-598 SS2]